MYFIVDLFTNLLKREINGNFKRYLQKEVWDDLRFVNELEKVNILDRDIYYYELVEMQEKLYIGECNNLTYRYVSSELQKSYNSISNEINKKLEKILLKKIS